MAAARTQTRGDTGTTSPRATRRPRQNAARAETHLGASLPIPPGPHRRAGRKRTISRNMRRFESAVGRLDLPGKLVSGEGLLAGIRAGTFYWSKLASALLLGCVGWVLMTIHTSDDWFVYAENIHFENVAHLDTPDLVNQLQVDGWNIFWLQPDALADRLLEHAGIADAQVQLQLPGRVNITISERRPVALWVTSHGVYRVADNGTALSRALTAEEVTASPTDMALPHIVDPLQEAQRAGAGDQPLMDAEVLNGALALIEALPDLQNRVRFNRSVGFNFALPDGEGWVYWGDGLHVDEKLFNLAAARQYVAENNTDTRIIDVRFLNRPFLR